MSDSSVIPGGTSLTGHVVVFTGKLSSVGRKEAHALVERCGGDAADEVTSRTTLLVVGSEGHPAARDASAAADSTEKTNKLRRAEQISLKGGSLRIISEDQFCALVGLPSPEALKLQYYALRDVLEMYPKIREDHLRYLQKFGLIRPVLRTNADSYVCFPDLLIVRQASAELEGGASFRAVLRSLQASRDGQLAFNFRLAAEPAKIIELPQRTKDRTAAPLAGRLPPPAADPGLAEEHFLAGSRLDDGDDEDLSAAAAAYRRALEADPGLVPALINLGNVHYARDERVEAQALYERAIHVDPSFFEAHFNLGNIHHDLGLFEEALACYAAALSLHPGYADTHFYMAVTYEKMGRSQDAKPHWKRYQQLAPDGEWVDLAREFSE